MGGRATAVLLWMIRKVLCGVRIYELQDKKPAIQTPGTKQEQDP